MNTDVQLPRYFKHVKVRSVTADFRKILTKEQILDRLMKARAENYKLRLVDDFGDWIPHHRYAIWENIKASNYYPLRKQMRIRIATHLLFHKRLCPYVIEKILEFVFWK